MKFCCSLAVVILVTSELVWSHEFAEAGATKFIASIRKRPVGHNVYETEFLCVGVLVSLTHVLTAASCVRYLATAELVVLVGSLELNSIGDGSSHVVEEIIIHPNFSAQGCKDNIALLKINAANRTICTPSVVGIPRIDNSVIQMLGWSGLKERLLVTEVLINNETACPFKSDGVLCVSASNSTIEACGGNLGSPVFFSSHVVAAIVVDDQFCESEGTLLSLQDYREWISETAHAGAMRVAGRTMFILTLISLRTKFSID